tara:strand:+ start:1376 stop:1579 length:204 start_codon:yes stop_codon:yes gene_type:complete
MVFFQYEMSINNNNEMDKIDFTKIAYCDFCNVSNEWWEMYYIDSEIPNCCVDCAEQFSDSDSDSDDE